MSEEVIPSERELYNDIVEMLSNGNFLQLNGKAINLTELNEYINAQGREIERLHSIIKEVREYIMKHCVNEKVSKEVGFKCYTMADTNELEHIMKLLGSDKE